MSLILNEIIGDEEENHRARMEDAQADIQTAMPALIVSFDPTEMTCTVQPLIKANRYKLDKTVEQINLPLLTDCPVIFPQGGGIITTYPIKKDDECLVIFSSRNIDNWWSQGGIQPQHTQRMHDLSDGFVLVGVRNTKRLVSNISLDSVQIRTVDGGSFVEIKESGDIVIKGDNISITGNTTFTGEVTANGHIIDERHLHKNVQTGSSNTGTVV